jgi:uncharacterized protein YbbK (DUF523 family)
MRKIILELKSCPSCGEFYNKDYRHSKCHKYDEWIDKDDKKMSVMIMVKCPKCSMKFVRMYEISGDFLHAKDITCIRRFNNEN